MDFSRNPLSMIMSLSLLNGNNNNINISYIFIIVNILFSLYKFIKDEYGQTIKNYLNSIKKMNTIQIPTHESESSKRFSGITTIQTISSDRYEYIIYYINKYKKEYISDYIEIMIPNKNFDTESYSATLNEMNQFILMPLCNDKFLISDEYNIYCTIQEKNQDVKDNNDKDNKLKKNYTNKNNFIFTLFIEKVTNKNNTHLIEKFIEECKIEYEEYLEEKNNKDIGLFIYTLSYSQTVDDKLQLVYTKNKLNHTKDLTKNIFFDDKDDLINFITPFKYNPKEVYNPVKEKYKRLGIPFKAGIIFYGHPGCGKTITIKGISAYLNRFIIEINLSKITTCTELTTILRQRTFNGRTFDDEQLIFVFEECDAFKNNFIQSREIVDKNDKNYLDDFKDLKDFKDISSIMDKSSKDFKVMNYDPNESDKINLSCFLNLLDGLIELQGIMIIMTTNHIDKIDKALIRPGRFDLKYEFKLASKKTIKEMLQFYYELSNKEINDLIDNINIKDGILSPAEISNICIQTKDPKDTLNKIILAQQK